MSAGNVKRERIQKIKREKEERGEAVDEGEIAENLPEQEVSGCPPSRPGRCSLPRTDLGLTGPGTDLLNERWWVGWGAGSPCLFSGRGVMGPRGDRAMNAVLPPPELSPFPPSDPDPERL